MANQYWKLKPGLNSVGSYQVSGIPYVTGSVRCKTAKRVPFPSVTKWFQIINKSAVPVKVGFSRAGLNGTPNNFHFWVEASGSSATAQPGYGKSEIYDLKVGELWLHCNDATQDVDVIAGLTSINTGSLSMSPATPSTSRSWSGSAGVG